MMLAFTALLALTALVAGGEVGHNQILEFPAVSNANYVSFKPGFSDLAGLTVCAWLQKSYPDDRRYWLSYAVPGNDNEIIVGEGLAGRYIFDLRRSQFGTEEVGAPVNEWVHLCTAWDSESGVATISVNGEVKATKENYQKGEQIRGGGYLVIGQEQDSLGGNFDANQAFVGKIYNLNIWDYGLNSTQIAYLYRSGFCGYGSTEVEPIISWADILNEDKAGDTAVVKGTCIDLKDPSVGKILRFPPQSQASTASFLQYTPDFGADELAAFSICTWFFKTYADQARYFFSYAESGMINSIIIGEQATLGFWVSGYKLLTDIVLDQQRWYHLCFTWGSEGVSAIYMDGVKVKEGAMAVGRTKKVGGVVVIGQEQDSVGGGYDANQAFAGSLYNLNMFNIKLSDEEVAKLYGEGTFCEMVPDEMWEAGHVVISYSDLFAQPTQGGAVFESGEEAWRHGAPHCSGEDLDEDAHKEDCWKTEEETRYEDKGTVGFLVGDVEAAKAACYAYKKCHTLTCYEKAGEKRCQMKSSFEKAKKDKNKTSYTYRC